MGGEGSGRPPNASTIVSRVQEQIPIVGNDVFIPNYSGLQNVKKTDTPVLTSYTETDPKFFALSGAFLRTETDPRFLALSGSLNYIPIGTNTEPVYLANSGSYVLKGGDTMTGRLILPSGTAGSIPLQLGSNIDGIGVSFDGYTSSDKISIIVNSNEVTAFLTNGNVSSGFGISGDTYPIAHGIRLKTNIGKICWTATSSDDEDVGITREGTNTIKIIDATTGLGNLICGTISGSSILTNKNISSTTTGNECATFKNNYDNYATNPTISYPIVRISRNSSTGNTYESAMAIGISRFSTVGTSGNTQADFMLINGNTMNTDATIMSLRSNGNVGIGTTAPSVKLDVAGAISGSSFRCGTQTGVVSASITTADLVGKTIVISGGLIVGYS